MSNIRLTDKGISERKEWLVAQEAYVGRLQKIKDACESEVVQLMVASVKKARDFAVKRVTDVAEHPINDQDDLKNLRIFGGQLQAFKSILNDFDDPTPQIEKAREQMAATRNAIEKAEKGELVS